MTQQTPPLKRQGNGLIYGFEDVEGDGVDEAVSCLIPLVDIDPVEVKVFFTDSISADLVQSYLDHCEKMTQRTEGLLSCTLETNRDQANLRVRIERNGDENSGSPAQMTIDHSGNLPAGGPTDFNPRYFTERVLDVIPGFTADPSEIDEATGLPFQSTIIDFVDSQNELGKVPNISLLPRI